MNTKITTTAAAVLLGISTLASANPPGAPAIYNNGPAAPLLNMTNMRDTERAAFALYEGLMQATEALVYVKGCTPFRHRSALMSTARLTINSKLSHLTA